LAFRNAIRAGSVLLAVTAFAPSAQAQNLFDFIKSLGVHQTEPSNAHRHGHRGQGGEISSNLSSIVAEASARNGVPVALVHRIIHVESGGRCSAENGIASGVMQVRPATARGVGVYGNLHDCRTGVEAGVRYLRQALYVAHGSWTGAATLYNRGIGARAVHSHYSQLVMR